jgi:hypothetical protein
VNFELYAWRFHFVADEVVDFPQAGAGNVLRGAFGSLLRQVSDEAEFRRIFAPVTGAHAPSGFADPPRPFVFRAAHLDGRFFKAGESFHFDLHYFETAEPPFEAIVRSFTKVVEAGLGPLRGRAHLACVEQLNAAGNAVHTAYDGLLQDLAAPLSLSLEPTEHIDRLGVQFVTPTELKAGGAIPKHPEFGVLFARVRDRLSTLRAFYGPGPLQIDFAGLRERADLIRTERCDVHVVTAERRSSRTGQVHQIGGFVGEAEYAGHLSEFFPFLRAAQWTGVGRHSVWGKGQIAVHGYTSRES